MGRRVNTRELPFSVAIIGEGISEKGYFNNLKKTEKLSSFKLKPDKPKHSDLHTIFAYADELSKEHDIVFCLIDCDKIRSNSTEQTKFSQLLNKYGKNPKVLIIENNPCFEIWFLSHFKSINKYFESDSQVVRELKKYEIFNAYDKSEEFFISNNVYALLKDKLADAMNNSRLSVANLDSIERFRLSYTQIFKIFEKLGIE